MKILKKHEDSKKYPEYWKKQNPNWTIEQCEEKAKWFKKSCNYLCIEYYERKYPKLSYKEHLELKKQKIIKKRENSKTNIKYWQKLYPEKSLIELEQLRSKEAKEKNKCNIKYWINKYPNKSKEEIKELYDNFYQSWKSHIIGWPKGEKNPNHKNNSTQQERNSRSPRNIEFYKRKYPNLSLYEQEELRQQYIQKNNKKIKEKIKDTNIEYYLNKGMSIKDAKEALKERQRTFSLEKCIQKYGEIEGLKKFTERRQKWLKSLHNNFIKNGDLRSPQSQFAKEIIKYCCNYLNISFPKSEKYIYDIINKCAYAYDFKYKNKIIEFQGDYWHCNPKLYDETFYNKVKQKTAKEIWEYDNQKLKCAERYNYQILYIWEYDYNNNKKEILKKCINFLNS